MWEREKYVVLLGRACSICKMLLVERWYQRLIDRSIFTGWGFPIFIGDHVNPSMRYRLPELDAPIRLLGCIGSTVSRFRYEGFD
jgi:hypothetical protein